MHPPDDMPGTAALTVLPESLRERLARAPLMLFLDVDGTLAPISARPEEAAVPAETKRVVAALAVMAGTQVVLVSGRSAAEARRMVSATHVWAVGNHGSEAIGPNGEEVVDERVQPYEASLARVARRLEALLKAVPGVIVEDKRWSLSVHYRLADPAVVPQVQATVAHVAAEHGLRLHDGKMVYEVRTPVEVDKGTAVLALARQLAGDDTLLAFIGGDGTDEDAFRALRASDPGALTVRVTHGQDVPTEAQYTLNDTGDVLDFLREVMRLRSV